MVRYGCIKLDKVCQSFMINKSFTLNGSSGMTVHPAQVVEMGKLEIKAQAKVFGLYT